jgi:hypothetical protein
MDGGVFSVVESARKLDCDRLRGEEDRVVRATFTKTFESRLVGLPLGTRSIDNSRLPGGKASGAFRQRGG